MWTSSIPSLHGVSIIACYNHKGGVGKTSNCTNLAVAMSESLPVLVIDCDPQMNFSSFMRHRSRPLTKGRKSTATTAVSSSAPAPFAKTPLVSLLSKASRDCSSSSIEPLHLPSLDLPRVVVEETKKDSNDGDSDHEHLLLESLPRNAYDALTALFDNELPAGSPSDYVSVWQNAASAQSSSSSPLSSLAPLTPLLSSSPPSPSSLSSPSPQQALYWVSGSPSLSLLERKLHSSEFVMRRHGSFRWFALRVALAVGCRLVMVDLGPASDRFNESILMSCDAILPTCFPDALSLHSSRLLVSTVLPIMLDGHCKRNAQYDNDRRDWSSSDYAKHVHFLPPPMPPRLLPLHVMRFSVISTATITTAPPILQQHSAADISTGSALPAASPPPPVTATATPTTKEHDRRRLLPSFDFSSSSSSSFSPLPLPSPSSSVTMNRYDFQCFEELRQTWERDASPLIKPLQLHYGTESVLPFCRDLGRLIGLSHQYGVPPTLLTDHQISAEPNREELCSLRDSCRDTYRAEAQLIISLISKLAQPAPTVTFVSSRSSSSSKTSSGPPKSMSGGTRRKATSDIRTASSTKRR